MQGPFQPLCQFDEEGEEGVAVEGVEVKQEGEEVQKEVQLGGWKQG